MLSTLVPGNDLMSFAYCPSTSGRSDHSFGRKKREINATVEETDPTELKKNNSEVESTTIDVYKVSYEEATVDQYLEETAETPKHVRKMIEVFDNRNEMMEEAQVAPIMSAAVCITSGEYHGLLTAIVTLLCLLMTVVVLSIYGYRRYWSVMKKNIVVDRPAVNTPNFVPPRVPNTRMSLFGSNLIQKPFAVSGLSRICDASGRTPSTSALQVAGNGFDDPSEPIYTDPSLFERSRSLRSLDMRQGHGIRSNEDLSKHIL